MTSTNSTNTFSGDRNQGFQLASNSGSVHVNFHEGPPIKSKPSSTVPFRRDPDFVDRDILAAVDEKLSKPASRVALVGLGGVGKSQLAIEYSYRVRERYPQTWVFWVHASNAARLEEGYRIIADRIKLPQRDKQTNDIIQQVSKWLSDEANGRWIIILDNADDPNVFLDPRKGSLKSETLLPQTPNGSLLVTSRSEVAAFRLIGSHQDIIKVEPMDEDHALLLLEKKLRGGFDKDDAIELLQALDYMPLAISQAAAYISQRAPWATVPKYLEDFRKNDRIRAILLRSDAGDLRRDSEASNSIITTWQISFEYLRDSRPSAARLLSLMSFFDPQGIPAYLLRHSHDREDGSNIDLKDDFDMDLEDDKDMDFNEDVFTLTNYSLITTNAKDGQFEMHRLVQFSTRNWLELNSELEKWKQRYIGIIFKAFPTEKYKNWTTCRVLFPHAEALLAYLPTEKEYLLCWCDVLNKAGNYARRQGNYFTAEKMNRRALEGRENVLGDEHPDTLISLSNLALVLRFQEKYEAAEEMSRRALNGREKALGKEHPDMLNSVNILATVLGSQGKYEAAEEMIRQALNRSEKTLEDEDPDTLMSVNNLATMLRSQGKYEAAEEMNRQALDGCEKALGKEHPDTLVSLSNLALVLRLQGRYEAAEEMSRRALNRMEITLGDEHPDTLNCVSNLVSVLRFQEKYEAADEMSRRALNGREKALGKKHPDTLVGLSNLASTLRSQGKHGAAEEMARRALDGYEKALGKEHPDTLMSVNKLALVLGIQGKYEATEEMVRRALDGYEKALGKEHPNTLTSLSNLASVLWSQGKYEAAEEINRRALKGREYVLGDEHPQTLKSVHSLARSLHQQKRYKDATPLYERSCAGYQKVLGINHPDTLHCSADFASMIKEMKKANPASTFFRQGEDSAGHRSSQSHRISSKTRELLHKVFS